MSDSFTRSSVLVVAILLGTTTVRAANEGKPLPQFAAVKTAVQRCLAAQKDYRPGDLLTQGDVTKILDELKESPGWDVADRREILASVVADDSPMAKRLRTTDGRKLMRQVARHPDGYDRIDRVFKLPDGERIMRRLSQGPDGYKLIEYLATTDGGHEMGKMVSKAPQGKNFNRPTGRIYTADQLLKRLGASHADAQRLASLPAK